MLDYVLVSERSWFALVKDFVNEGELLLDSHTSIDKRSIVDNNVLQLFIEKYLLDLDGAAGRL